MNTSRQHVRGSARRPLEFGHNRNEFLRRKLHEERIRIAQEHLLAFLKTHNLKGLNFLKIGSARHQLPGSSFRRRATG
jgi:hypothetical protein